MSTPACILVINCGSSSVKAALIDPESGHTQHAATATRLGSTSAEIEVNGERNHLEHGDHACGIRAVLTPLLATAGEGLAGIGHRVVHGGETFRAPTLLDEQILAQIEALTPLAPLHNPANVAGIRIARELAPAVPHVAVFDTAFHATLPRRARTYALDQDLCDKHGLRRYGFHGTSHAYVARLAALHLDAEAETLRIVTCHLGNGASVAAVEWGRSVETSMGLTPLEGLVMGTRSGDVDPGALLALARAEGYDLDALDTQLNRHSGLAGISGLGKDMREIEAAAAEGHERARLALQVFCHRVLKYIGAYAAVMGGVDAIVFTGGIGENSATVRQRVAARLDYLGARFDPDLNQGLALEANTPVAEFSSQGSRCRLLTVKTNEALEIARASAAIIAQQDLVQGAGPIPIAVSARHIHLTKEACETLFGPGHELTPRNPLSQPGQFACEETLSVIGPKGRIERVRVLGPLRNKNQVEISRTDEFKIGVDAPVRPSGKTQGSAPCVLEGPAGRLHLKEGLICASRHIHMRPQDAEAHGVKHGDIVEVAIDSAGRDLIFGDVMIRVSAKYALEMHIDTDEANAAELARSSEGLLVATSGRASLRRKRSR